MRTDGLSAALRIEVRRVRNTRDVVIVDPVSEESVTLAEELEASQLDEVNNYLWIQLDRIARSAKSDPTLRRPNAAQIAREIYLVGFAALLMFARHSPDDERRVQAFCAARAEREGPLLLDVIADRRDRLIIEPLPLFGSLDLAGEGDVVDVASLASVMAGFRAIVRHRRLEEPAAERRDGGTEVPIPVRFFRHNGLLGSRRELASLVALERKGKASVVQRYPPTNFKPPDQGAELGLARALSDPRGAAPDSRTPAGLVCHFACHQRETEDGPRLELKADGRKSEPARYRIEQIGVGLAHHPPQPPVPKLCFLSACRSAVVDRNLILSAADAMSRLRPASVVGVLATVPDLIAAEFAARFYARLSDGWSVCAAISYTRAELLAEPLRNPLGLLFVSHFGEDVYFRTHSDVLDRFIPIDRPAAA